MGEMPLHYWSLRIGRDVAAIILLIVFPIIQVFATRAAPAAVAAAIFCILLMHLVTRGAYYVPFSKRQLHTNPVMVTLLLALVWWIVSLFWSPDLRFAARDIGGILLLCAAVVVLPLQLAQTTILPFASILLIGTFSCALILTSELEAFTRLHTMFSASARVWDLNRTALFLVLVLPAVGLIITRGGRLTLLALPVAVLCLVAVLSSESQSAQLALIAGLLVVPVAVALPAAGRLAAIGFAVLLLAMPMLTASLDTANKNGALPNVPAAHAEHRIALWAGYNDVIEERPWFGWGAGSARYMGTTGRATKIAYERGYPKWTTNPHNAPLEIWAELGAVGAVLISLVMWGIGSAIDREPRGRRVALMFIYASATVFSFVSSSLYQGWWLSTLAIGIVSCLAVSYASPANERSKNRIISSSN